ncbi:multiple inositol polyphosphate phosphatase 1-like [Galleria mellonella]|uniref:Multiple inositol polyphosphate phosphatase 1 n=1 Tax=Galleria mellonella TaxID=7137 RepID=A0A6J1WIW7_GALME|nr:multiple inositol polyphosphate phosphatase 1-like [Galleria mellonella]
MRWLAITVLVTAVAGQEPCLSVDENPYLLFGSKTAYLFANHALNTNRVHEIPGCQPTAFWLASRHGSNNPEASEIPKLQHLTDLKNNILDNYRNRNFRNTNRKICSTDVELLERWQWNPYINTTFAEGLTSEGYMTTQQLARAWKQRYPGLLTDNPHDYLVKYVDEPLYSASFRAFTDGMFRGPTEGLDIPKENDEKTIRPYKFCPAWKNNVGENNDTLSQMHIFQSKQEYKEMITNISLRLGFNYGINPEIVYSMYQMCRYNKAWDNAAISQWCAAFTREDLKRIEYAEDLETYYKYGYGTPQNQNIGCSLLRDMMGFFTKHIENDPQPQQPRAQINLIDSPMLLMLLTAMNTHQDTAPLTGDNYHTSPIQARKWTTSKMSPFNANAAAILYKCTINGNFQVKERYQVLFLENEYPMYVEGCRVGLCDWSYVVNKFGALANTCDLKFCNSAVKINGFSALFAVLVYFGLKLV